MRGSRILKAAMFAICLVVLLAGAVGVGGYFELPKAQTISGSQVVDLNQCSGGFGAGQCPVSSYSWTGTLLNPNGTTFSSIWAVGSGGDTCGLQATYATNIPSSGSQPEYLPAGAGIAGTLESGSVVYVYTTARYTVADGCHGNNLPGASQTPIEMSFTYSLGTGMQSFSTEHYTNNFGDITFYWTLLVGGGFTTLVTAWILFGGGSAPPPIESAEMAKPH